MKSSLNTCVQPATSLPGIAAPDGFVVLGSVAGNPTVINDSDLPIGVTPEERSLLVEGIVLAGVVFAGLTDVVLPALAGVVLAVLAGVVFAALAGVVFAVIVVWLTWMAMEAPTTINRLATAATTAMGRPASGTLRRI